MREWKPRLEPNCLLEARHRILEPLLHRENAAQVFVQMWKIRLQRDRLANDLLGFRVARLLPEGVTEQAKVIDGARVLL